MSIENKYYCKLCGGELEPKMKVAKITTHNQIAGQWVECSNSNGHHKNPEDWHRCKGIVSRINSKIQWSNPLIKTKRAATISTDEYKLKRNMTFKNLWKDPLYRLQQSISRTLKWDDPEYKNYMKKCRKEEWQNPEIFKKHSIAMQNNWKDPNYRSNKIEKTKLTKSSYEYKNKIDAIYRSKGVWNFAPSKPELRTLELCKSLFGANNVVSQYKSKEYNHYCDIYIKTIKLYIECQYFWGHGNHPIGDDLENDIKMIEDWIEKSKTSDCYCKQLCTILHDDVNKREEAERNNLRYLELFNEPKNELELSNKINEYMNKYNRECII